MINVKCENGETMLKSEGSTFMLSVEAVCANVALANVISQIRNVSFENACLLLMQESIKYHNTEKEIDKKL